MELPDSISPALEELLGRFAGLVRGIGLRHGLTEHELDELVQSVRLRLWHARGTGEQIGAAPASYVYRTAKTAALDLIRSRRHREEPIDALEDRLEAPPGMPRPDSALESAELGSIVSAAVDQVTPSRRPVLRMYLAGYDRDEIGSLLGWTEAKTRNLLYRGLAELRALLQERGIGPGGATST
jgi:RNA polymerase sigma factor (sigma-70 family)